MADQQPIVKPATRVPRRRLALLGLGTVASIMLGSALFALLSDSITIPGNSLESGTYEPPSHDLQVAVLPEGEDCFSSTSLVWTDTGPIAASIDAGVDLNGGTASVDGPAFCLRNNGTDSGLLTFHMDEATYADTEVGPCEDSEVDAGDTSCAHGDAGELRDVIHLDLFWHWLEVDIDGFPFTTGNELGFTPQNMGGADFDFPAGGLVQVWVSHIVRGDVTESQLLMAQTDRIDFDIVFTLQDVPAP